MANKTQKLKENEKERLINQLPDEIVISSILSRLTFNELASTRLVSHHWNRSWHHISVLNFDENITSQESVKIKQEISSFVNKVNHVVGEHMGCTIDQFKVSFGLHNTYKSDIDTWLVWAFSKHVKKLELNFSTCPTSPEYSRYFLDQSLIKVKPVLTSLCLKSVNVTTQGVEQLLESCCSTLENLCVESSDQLTSISTTKSLQSLKYFKVYGCRNLDTIDISAPKLLSFTYQLCALFGYKLLRIANASSLSELSIGDRLIHDKGPDSLSTYFSQLECLKLVLFSYPHIPKTVINSPPVLANLKHLELCVFGVADKTIAGWIPFIEACPILQKLTLRLHTFDPRLHFGREFKPYVHPPKRDKHPLQCLKTLEIIGYVGYYIDLDVANYVLENSLVLQELIIKSETLSLVYLPSTNCIMLSGAWDLRIPPGVKLIFI